jgi:hypothetical protein
MFPLKTNRTVYTAITITATIAAASDTAAAATNNYYLLLLVEFKECNRPMVIQKTALYQQNHSSQ